MKEYIILQVEQPIYDAIKSFPHFVIADPAADNDMLYTICVSKSLGDKFVEYIATRGDEEEIFKAEIAEIERIITSVKIKHTMRRCE